jgi:tetratricopeptide (TPR) repeat protein
MPIAQKNLSRNAGATWLYSPSLDLIVGCGAWSLPLLSFAYFFSASSTLTWSVAFYVLALFFNYPHYMATIYRAYHTAADFQKYRIFTVHITLLVALTIILSHVWVQALPWIFTIYLTVSPWHYSGQNYGLFMMFARRAGAKPTPLEGRTIYATFLISYAILFLNFHTGHSADPLFVSLNIPNAISSWAQIGLAALFVVCSAFAVGRFTSHTGWRKMIPSLTLFSTQCVWFFLPTVLSLWGRFRVPQSRYSTGVLAVMHSAQYLWVTSYYAKREASATSGRSWRPFAYFTILIAGGIALFVPGPWLSSLVFHFDLTRSFLIFTALVNIHHFVLDGAIWKLRDGRIATLLLKPRNQISQSVADVRTRTTAMLRWLVGQTSGARFIRVGAVLLLLAWGSMDQVHYYLALHSHDLADLKRAAALAPYDAPLQARVARASLEEGKSQDSVTAWEYAIKADPSDPAPRETLLRYLIHEKQLDVAYQLTGDWLKDAPNDATLLMNHGILAQQFGKLDDAEQSWQKALALDPSQSYADLYLALALDRQNKLDRAITYYEAFLAKIAQPGTSNPLPPGTLITVVLKLADCNARVNRLDRAFQFYKMARTLAAKTKEQKLESFAAIAEASLAAKLGRTSDALQFYQSALKIDATMNDPHNEAVDWYSYAMFLGQTGFPARYAYAALLKSQELFPPESSDAALATSSQSRKALEQQLGFQATRIRRDPKPLLKEAMELER